tara:strand:- start:7539 stop:7973 length:435 start_codon:yes stop_codon:yes gene_type:complete
MQNNIKNAVFNRKEFSSFSYKFISIFLTIMGVVFFYFSIKLYLEPIQKIDWNKIKEDSFNVCEQTAIEKGYSITRDYQAGKIEMKLIDLNNPVVLIAEAENVLLRCQNFEMVSFCVGDREDCGIFGVNQTLQYKQPSLVKSIYK